MAESYFTYSEVLEVLGLAEHQLHDLISSGKLHPQRGENGLLFPKEEVRKLQGFSGLERFENERISPEKEGEKSSAAPLPASSMEREGAFSEQEAREDLPQRCFPVEENSALSRQESDPSVQLSQDTSAEQRMWLVLEEAEKQRPPETIKGPSPPRTEVVIEFQEVVKILSNRPILNGLSLKVYKGETLCIIGPSGTGKSTTLKHLVGLMRPDRGKVFVYGEDITEFTHKQILEMRKRFGVLFQFGALLNSMTVGQNVALPLVEHERLKRKEIERIVDEKLEMVEMLHAKHNYPSEISGGMKKRAGLARAIVRNPEIVLYDEPTSGLDPIMSNSINELIISMQNRLNITSIVVTHDMSSAYMIADRIALLHEGRVIQVGTPEEIRHTTNPVVRQFIEGRVRGPLSKKV